MQESKWKRAENWVNGHKVISVFIIFLILLWLMISVATVDSPSSGSTPATSPGTETLSAYEQVICNEFIKMAKDIDAGILTDSELREQAKKVYEKSRYTDFENVARDLLSAITSGNEESMKLNYTAMIVLCNQS